MTNTVVEFGRTIEGFPNYEVTNHGRVFNTRTGREMTQSPTMTGDLTVGLTRYGHQYRFSTKCLVARAFVDGETELFNTPILLDGNKRNLNASNIVWRPRWFAWKYTRQFNHPFNWYVYGPVADRETLSQYRNYFEAAKAHGLLCSDIMESIYNDRPTFPTFQSFSYVE